jgi:hypothetical protein
VMMSPLAAFRVDPLECAPGIQLWSLDGMGAGRRVARGRERQLLWRSRQTGCQAGRKRSRSAPEAKGSLLRPLYPAMIRSWGNGQGFGVADESLEDSAFVCASVAPLMPK